ncbi:MAG: GNAT family N-acetyltransferase [Polyangiales bacterium]
MRADFEIEGTPGHLVDWSAYASIPIAFEVRSELEVVEQGLSGIALRERTVAMPWRKDYDAVDQGPRGWSARFRVQRWTVLLAREGTQLTGAASVMHDSPDIQMLDGRSDLALLWDLRVAPAWRGRGVGAALFEAAASHARERGCRQLKVETQNINLPACRFYQRMGCRLGGVQRHAYALFPDEAQLLWYLEL